MKETGLANLLVVAATVGGMAYVTSDPPVMTTQPVVVGTIPPTPDPKVAKDGDRWGSLWSAIADLTDEVEYLKKKIESTTTQATAPAPPVEKTQTVTPKVVEPSAAEKHEAMIAARDANYTGIVVSVYDPVGSWNGTGEHPCEPCLGLIEDVREFGNDWTIGLNSDKHFWVRKAPEDQHGQPMLLIFKNGKMVDKIHGYAGLLKAVLRIHPNLTKGAGT